MHLGLVQGGALDPDPCDIGLVSCLCYFYIRYFYDSADLDFGRSQQGLRERWLWASRLHPDQFSIMQNQNKQTGV